MKLIKEISLKKCYPPVAPKILWQEMYNVVTDKMNPMDMGEALCDYDYIKKLFTLGESFNILFCCDDYTVTTFDAYVKKLSDCKSEIHYVSDSQLAGNVKHIVVIKYNFENDEVKIYKAEPTDSKQSIVSILEEK